PVRTFTAPSGITGTTATLGWTAPTGATQYNVQYRATGSCTWTNWTGNPVSTNSVTITGLTAATSYQVRVQACTASLNGLWSHVAGSTAGTGVTGYTAAGTFTTSFPDLIGGIGSASGLMPLNSCYDYSYSQQLIYASEYNAIIGGSNTYITKLRFYYNTAATATTFNNWTIYMGNTTKTAFANTTDWVPTGSMTQVFSGVVSVPAAGNWLEVTLTTPFTWNGTNNIVIGVDENVTGYSCTAQWGSYTAAPANRGIYFYADGTNPNPAAPPVGTLTSDINGIRIVATTPPSCFPPSALLGTPTSSVGANISWTAPSPAPSNGYQFAVTTSATPPGSGTAFAGTSTSVGGLSPNTTYYLHVRSDCGGGIFSSWATSASFTTPCAEIVAFPFTETFEAASTSRPCWTQIQEVGAGLWSYAAGSTATVTTAHGGALNARFVSLSGADNPITKLVSPVFDLTSLTTPRVRFWYAQPNWAGDINTLRVYYRTSQVAPWVLIATYNPAVEAWTEVDVLLPNASATYQIAFEGRNNWGRANVIDDVVVEEAPSCLPPTGLTGVYASNTSANISWTAAIPVPSNGYEWAVTTSATPPGSGNPLAGTSTTATGLTSGNFHYLHVRSNCGVGGFSNWVTSAPFWIPMPGQIGYSEIVGGAALPINSCYDYSYSQQLYTPAEMNLAVGGNTYITKLRFYYATSIATPTWNSWTIYMGNTAQGTFTSATNWVPFASLQQVFTGTVTVPSVNNWMEVTLATPFIWDGTSNVVIAVDENITGWACTAGFGAFNTPPDGRTLIYYADGTNPDPNSPPTANGWYYTRNAIQLVSSAPPTCYPPTNVLATPTSTTLCDVSWGLPSGGNAPVQYFYEVTTSPTPSGGGTPTASTSATGVATVPNVINYLHVRTDCDGGGLDYSTWATYSFYSGYCQIANVAVPTDDYITNVTTTSGITNINNTSTFASGYQDFSATSASQYLGEDLNMTVTFSPNYSCGLAVYIDWNNDLDFTDGGEQVYSSNGYWSPGATVNIGTIEVPIAAPTGNHRMRIVLDESTGNPLPCGITGNLYGEVEDYTINVVALPACTSVTYAGTYTTNANTLLVCTGQDVSFYSLPPAPVATNITYDLQFSTAIGGPYNTVAGPQADNNFTYGSIADGYYRIRTFCNGSPVASAFTPVGITLSNPDIVSTTPGANCGPGSVTLEAQQSPLAATVAWYNSLVSTTPLAYGNTYNTPVIGTTTTYYVEAQNIIPTTDIGSGLSTTNSTGWTPYSSLWENVRTYYLVKKADLNAAGIYAGDLSSLAFFVTTPGAYPLNNFAMRMATTTAANLSGGFGTATGAFTTVYTNASLPIPAAGWNTMNFSTNFTWNGTDNIIVELCHEADITASCFCYGTNSTVRITPTSYISVYSKYQDNAAICGLNVGTEVVGNARPNMRFGATASTCNSARIPVTATINALPNISGPSNQNFVPTILSFNPIPLTATSTTPGATVIYTPPSSIYIDALTSALYVGGNNINGITQYFAPLSTTTYSAVATAPNGCSVSSPFTITVDASGLPNSACSATNINTNNTLTFSTVNTLGAVPGIGFPCGGIANQVWFQTLVPASGEVHVVTKASGVSLTDLTASNIALFTSTSCTAILNTACDYNGGPGDFSYTYTQATPGSTVYIRVAGLAASAIQNGKASIAVTAGLVWSPTNGDNVALAENWQAGDATALTTTSANQSIIIPAGTTKPKLYANTSVRGVSLFSAPPYFASSGIDLNSFTLNVKGNWYVGPVASATCLFNCNGLVEFNGTTPQVVTSGKTTFGNVTLNNSFGLTLNSSTSAQCVLKHSSGVITSNGNLILRSTAANTAALVDPSGTGSITGSVSVERKIGTVSGYHYLSAPVSGAMVNNTTTGWRDDFTIISSTPISFVPGAPYSTLPTVWQYDETNPNPNPDYGWISATQATDAITPLKGFACVVPGNVVVDVYGPINNGTIPSYNVTLASDGLNLLGNPYPSPISWNSFRGTNASVLSPSGYKAFVTSGGYAGSYGTWDGSFGTSGVTDRIASSQSFMVTATGNSTVSAVNLNRLVSAADVNATFFGYNYVPNALRMDVTGNGFAAQTAVYFDNARSDAFDNDATTLFSPNPGVPTIYTFAGNKALNINAMGKLDMDKVVPMGVKIQTAGTYNLVATDMTSFAPSVIAYLEDTQAGTMTNLRTNPSYSVTLPEGEINNRFYIHFHPAVELNAVNETCAGNDGKLIINYPTTNTVNMIIKDANGNVVSTLNNVSGNVTVNNLVAGNYVAEMTFGVAPNTYTTSDYFTVAGGNAVYANLSASANSVDMNANTTVNFTATAQGASSFNWNFGDGTVIANGPANVAHTFTAAGTYTVTIEASNGICNTISTTTVEVTNATGLTAIANSNLQVVGVGSKVTVRFGNKMEGTGNIEVINMLGEVVAHLDNVSMKGTREIEMSNIAAGQYMVKITNNNKLYTEKVFLSRQ
ncbi:MAG TPA: fibronectin type III domain-containing protein, partial [Bacteroidia bacterium]|nr:fibronectin type III domain-containing protein [Bacteroidia bacterium]